MQFLYSITKDSFDEAISISGSSGVLISAITLVNKSLNLRHCCCFLFSPTVTGDRMTILVYQDIHCTSIERKASAFRVFIIYKKGSKLVVYDCLDTCSLRKAMTFKVHVIFAFPTQRSVRSLNYAL